MLSRFETCFVRGIIQLKMESSPVQDQIIKNTQYQNKRTNQSTPIIIIVQHLHEILRMHNGGQAQKEVSF